MKDGTRNDAVDSLLRDIESQAESPYRALLEGHIPTGSDRSEFAIFLATLHLRSPGMIRCMAEMRGRLLATHLNEKWSTFERYDKFLDRMDAELGTVTKDRRKAYEFWRDTKGYSISIDRTEGFRALASAGDIAEILRGRHWYLLDTLGDYFITSDQPVERSTPGLGDGGFRNPQTEVSFPLSPERCLLITGANLGTARHVVGPAAVAKLNGLRARYAERLVWSHLKSDAVGALVGRFKSERLEIRFSNHDQLPDIDIERTRFGTSPSAEGDR